MRARRRLLVCVLAVCAAALHADWDGAYASRLERSLAYRRAVAQLRQAELKVAQQERVYVPYVDLRSVGQSGVFVSDGALRSSTVAADLRFENVLGVDLSFTAPVVFGGGAGLGLGRPTVTLSRKLFEETANTLLRARAALLRAQGAVEDAAADVRLGLVSDVLEAWRSARVVQSSHRDLQTLERLGEATRSETDARAVKRRILQARRAILQAESALRAIDAEVRAEAEALYPAVRRLVEEWVRPMPAPGASPPESRELEALALELAAAERERSLAILPYLPNPTLTAGLSYDPAAGTLGWQLSLIFSTDVVDRGERAAAAYARREGPDLARLAWESASRTRERAVAAAWTSLEVLELDRQIQALDVEDARETARQRRELYEGGFVTEEDAVMAEVDLAVEELDAEKIEHDYLKKQLELLKYYRLVPGEGTK